jgi:alpha-galactosidase
MNLRRLFCLGCVVVCLTRANGAATTPVYLDIATAHSALTLWVLDDGRIYQNSYGRPPAKHGAPKKTPDRETEFEPAYGNGFILEPAIQATHADGNTSTDLKYVSHEVSHPDPDITLTRIAMKDPAYPFFVDIYFKAYQNEDVLEEWATIRHEEDGPVTLYRFASSALQIKGRDHWLTQFHGDWSREAEIREEPLAEGIKILDSKIGVRASQYRIPSFILSQNHPAKEDSGEVYGGSLKWSGSYQLAFDVDWQDRLRVLAGINPFGSQYPLAKNETLALPGMLWTWSDQGKGQVSRNFHAWARKWGIRDGDVPRPVLLNNWEATYFNFNEAKLVSLFDQAKELGFEIFLLDDGWFGNKHPRNNDNAGLGDWQVNTAKLPQGIGYLTSEAAKRGLRFGLWLEPEMVNPQSDLYEKHPDWAIAQPHRDPQYMRHQLNLDLSNPAVQDFVWKTLDDTLGANPGISYIKWDANRYVTQPGSPWLKPGEQSRLLVDYNIALYRIMARMAAKYPHVMAMLCSGGSGRADYGAMQYFDSFWPSDNTDPAKRVFIQWGFSHIFPALTMCAHVTRSGHRPLKFALDVAMSADLGFDVDLAKTAPEERETMARAIDLYKKELRDVVDLGDLYRLESPYDGPRSCLNYVTPDKAKAVLFVYQLKNGDASAVKPHGLDPQRNYTVREVNLAAGASSTMPAAGQSITGADLMRNGLVPPCKNAFDSAVVELVAEK